MPFITEDQVNQSTPVVAPQPVAPPATPQQPTATPSFGEVRDAAFAQSNILGSVLQRYAYGGYQDFKPQPNYSPFDNDGREITGYDPERFVKSVSPEQTQVIKNLITAETSDKETLARAGAWGFTANLAAGAVDPITLALMAVPGVGEAAGLSRVARIGTTVAANVGLGEAQAAALAANQETGSYTEGMIPRIGVNALLSGVLGAIATRVPRAELDALAKRASEQLNATGESTAGAMQVPATTLEEETIARGGQAIAKSVGQISPITRVFTNGNVEARQLGQRMVDVPFMLEKNLKGTPTASNAEMRIKQQEDGRNAQLIQAHDALYAEYKQGGGDMSLHQFDEEVHQAAYSGDQHEIPEVRKMAAWLRPMFEKDHGDLVQHGAIADGPVVGAESYFPRVYDQPKIQAHLSDFTKLLEDHFTANPKVDEKATAAAQAKADTEAGEGKKGEPVKPVFVDRSPAEVKSAVYDALDHIQGMTRGVADIGQNARTPDVLKTRALDVPDSVLHPYLMHDLERVIPAYNRAVLPQIELRKNFSGVTLDDEFQQVHDAYRRQLELADTDEKKAAIRDQEKATDNDLRLLLDRLLNQTGPKNNTPLAMVRTAQLVRSFNYLRMLGSQTLSALPDVGRLVTRYGLMNTGVRLAQFLTKMDSGLMRADAQRMGTALDNVIHTRMHTLEGIGDELGGSELSQRMHNATARFTKITGIASWDAMMRTLSAQLEQDAIHRLITRDGLSALERGKLAAHGIGDDDIAAIRDQWQKHGSDENGLNRARTDLWTNRSAAAKVEEAVQRAGSSNAFFVGKGDLPGFANSQLGKMIIQFKAFAISSVNRLAIPLAQGLAHGDLMAANGLASMLALGALTYYTKELAAGRKPDLSPHNLVPEAVQRSGILTFLPDLYDPAAGAFHLPRFSKFQDLNPLETALGPSAGTAATVLDTVRRMTKGNIAQSDLHKLRQLVPYQNLFYFTRIVNAVEGKIGDAIGAKHAPDKPALDYVNPAQDPSPKDHPDKQHFLGIQQVPNRF